MRRPLYNKIDFFVFGIVILLSIIPIFTLNGKDGSRVVISKFGKEVATYKLSENRIIEIQGEYPLTVNIESGAVYITDAHCPDKLCSKSGKISRAHGVIVCAPAGVSVYIQSDDMEVDGLAW